MAKFHIHALIFIFLPIIAFGAEEAAIRSFREVETFLTDATPRQTPFELCGTVDSSFQPSTSPTDKGRIVLSDTNASHRTEIHLQAGETLPLAGDTIKARGVIIMGRQNEPLLMMDEFEVLGKGKSPEPTDVRLSEVSASEHHLMTIRTEGTVFDVLPDEADRRYQVVILKDDGRTLSMPLPIDPFGDQRKLIDARIRVTGIFRRSVTGVRKFSRPNLQPQTPADIEIITSPPDDPFAVQPLEKRLYLSSEEIALMSKRSTTGCVLATWSGDKALLREDDGRIVNLKFANGVDLPPCDMTVLAVGHPETDLFRINLTAARWKAIDWDLVSGNETPQPCTVATFWRDDKREIINDEAHGKLLTVRGSVGSMPPPGAKDPRLILDTGDFSVPVDFSAAPSRLEDIEPGCRLQITGRGLLLAASGPQSDDLPLAQGFAIVVRSPADVMILSRPPWWTPRRLMIVISLLFVALVAVYIWNRVLQKLVNRRGRELYREQIAHAIADFKKDERTRLAVELHDSLSQALAGVACHIEAAANTVRSDPDVSRRFFDTAGKMLDSCRTELRYCLFDLRNDMLEEPDFPSAVRKSLGQLDGNASIKVELDVRRSLIEDTTAHAILAIVRELTGNAIRHGSATEVRIEGKAADGKLRITVRDNGNGFDPDHCNGPLQGHFGLEGIRNRLEKLNGSFAIESKPGAGTTAAIEIPLKD